MIKTCLMCPTQFEAKTNKLCCSPECTKKRALQERRRKRAIKRGEIIEETKPVFAILDTPDISRGIADETLTDEQKLKYGQVQLKAYADDFRLTIPKGLTKAKDQIKQKKRRIEVLEKIREKINQEKNGINGQKQKAMTPAVIDALLSFTSQNAEFGQAILESDKTFKACMDEVVKGVGNWISDLEAYRKAVAFYFPGADIKFNMSINLCASVGGDDSNTSFNLSLEDLLEA